MSVEAPDGPQICNQQWFSTTPGYHSGEKKKKLSKHLKIESKDYDSVIFIHIIS